MGVNSGGDSSLLNVTVKFFNTFNAYCIKNDHI